MNSLTPLAGRLAAAAVAMAAMTVGSGGQPAAPPVALDGSRAAPAGAPTPGPVDVTGARAVSLSLRGLEKGHAPKVAWLNGTVLVRGSHRARVPAAVLNEAFAVAPWGTGSVVLTWARYHAMS